MYNQDTHTGPSFSFRNRAARLVWKVTYALFFFPTPNMMFGWRAFLLRCFGARVGRNVHVYPRVRIWAPWNLDLGDEAGIADGVTLYSQDQITIGRRAVISQGAHLCTGTHDHSDPGHRLVTCPIHVGDHAWLAAESFILPGVRIGEGAVIGARSLVTKDMPAWMVCGGHPCQPIRERKFNHGIRIDTD